MLAELHSYFEHFDTKIKQSLLGTILFVLMAILIK